MADLKDLWDSIREDDTASTAQAILGLGTPEAQSAAYREAIADKSDIEILALQISLYAYHPDGTAGVPDRWNAATREDFETFSNSNEAFQTITAAPATAAAPATETSITIVNDEGGDIIRVQQGGLVFDLDYNSNDRGFGMRDSESGFQLRLPGNMISSNGQRLNAVGMEQITNVLRENQGAIEEHMATILAERIQVRDDAGSDAVNEGDVEGLFDFVSEDIDPSDVRMGDLIDSLTVSALAKTVSSLDVDARVADDSAGRISVADRDATLATIEEGAANARSVLNSQGFVATISTTVAPDVDVRNNQLVQPFWDEHRIESGSSATVENARAILSVSEDLRESVYNSLTASLTAEQNTALDMSIYFHMDAPDGLGGFADPPAAQSAWENTTFEDIEVFRNSAAYTAITGDRSAVLTNSADTAEQSITITADPDKVISITFEGLETDAERLAFIEANREAIQTQITVAVTAHLEANDDPDGTFELLNQNWDLAYMGDDLDSTDDDNQNRATVEINSMAMDTVRTLRPATPEAEADNASTDTPTADGDEWFVISSTKTDAIAALQQALGADPDYQAALGARGWAEWADGEIGSRTHGVIRDYANKHDIDPNSMSIEDFTQHVKDNLGPRAVVDTDPAALRIAELMRAEEIDPAVIVQQRNALLETGKFDGEISAGMAEIVALGIVAAEDTDITLADARNTNIYREIVRVHGDPTTPVSTALLTTPVATEGDQPIVLASAVKTGGIAHSILSDDDRVLDVDALEEAQKVLDQWVEDNPGVPFPAGGILSTFDTGLLDNRSPMLVFADAENNPILIQLHAENYESLLGAQTRIDTQLSKDIVDDRNDHHRDHSKYPEYAEHGGLKFAVDPNSGTINFGRVYILDEQDGKFHSTYLQEDGSGGRIVETDELKDALERFDHHNDGRLKDIFAGSDSETVGIRHIFAGRVGQIQEAVEADPDALRVTFGGSGVNSYAEINTSSGEPISIPRTLYDAIVDEASANQSPEAKVGAEPVLTANLQTPPTSG